MPAGPTRRTAPEPTSTTITRCPAMTSTHGPERVGSGSGEPAPQSTTLRPSVISANAAPERLRTTCRRIAAATRRSPATCQPIAKTAAIASTAMRILRFMRRPSPRSAPRDGAYESTIFTSCLILSGRRWRHGRRRGLGIVTDVLLDLLLAAVGVLLHAADVVLIADRAVAPVRADRLAERLAIRKPGFLRGVEQLLIVAVRRLGELVHRAFVSVLHRALGLSRVVAAEALVLHRLRALAVDGGSAIRGREQRHRDQPRGHARASYCLMTV